MTFEIKYKSSIAKDLKKIDKTQCKKILGKVESYLPFNPGKDKELSGKYKGLYSYRIGDYRIIYTILKKERAILILRISHRKKVYKNVPSP